RPNCMEMNIAKIFARSWGLMMTTTPTWEGIAGEKTRTNESFRSFVAPWVIFCSIVSLVFGVIYADSKVLETGFLHAVITSVSLFAAFFLTKAFSFSFFAANISKVVPRQDIEKLLAYSFTVVFVIKVITDIIPSLFFLKILNVYTAYIVWEGCNTVLVLDEDNRGKMMIMMSSCIVFLPGLISKIIRLMLPAF
ncbi:MAG: hypothetical protein H6Q20_1273, partial [Bacteroidetes bacterium]|nr:hypothetical protein [Bacteroidota bacterium]